MKRIIFFIVIVSIAKFAVCQGYDETQANNSVQESVVPGWNQAKYYIYESLFPDFMTYHEFASRQATDKIFVLYSYINPPARVNITQEDLKKWNIPLQKLRQQAAINMNLLADSCTLKIDPQLGHILVTINTRADIVRSSLIFSEHFINRVQKILDFPFYCLVPTRDSCYIFSQKNKEYFLGKLKDKVKNEYKESNDFVSLEIIKISDKGIEVIGHL